MGKKMERAPALEDKPAGGVPEAVLVKLRAAQHLIPGTEAERPPDCLENPVPAVP